MSAIAAIEQLAGLYTPSDFERDADQRAAAYWWGAQDEDVAWWLGMCKLVAPDPIAQTLYLASVAVDIRHHRQIKEWAYRVAVEYAGAKGSGQRKRSLVESYRPEWGHQAARDGVASAMWGSDGIPGIGTRCEALKCGKQAYQRVRDEVNRQASDLIVGFRTDMEQCRKDRFSRDFTDRWQAATGRDWPRH